MKIFLSWSGQRSQAVAAALRDWIPNVIQSAEPWMSAQDIDKGVRWGSEIASRLNECSVGIICLTSDNLKAPWILFEAGALSRSINDDNRVCPYLLDIQKSDVEFPLAQFQSTLAQKDETRQLMHTINKAQEKALSDLVLARQFDKWWLDLEGQLQSIPPRANAAQAAKRSEREILDEILELLRVSVRMQKLAEKSEEIDEKSKAVSVELKELERRISEWYNDMPVIIADTPHKAMDLADDSFKRGKSLREATELLKSAKVGPEVAKQVARDRYNFHRRRLAKKKK